MKITIAKHFDFDAAHFLPLMPDGHKCRNMHGHTYRVEIQCEGSLDERGVVVDYQQIADGWAALHKLLDHKVLNEIDGLQNPTTEVLAPWILARLRKSVQAEHSDPEIGSYAVVVAVRVYESSTTWCEARL